MDGRAGGIITELQTENRGLRGMVDALCEGSQPHSFEMVLKLRAARNMDESPGREPVQIASYQGAFTPIESSTDLSGTPLQETPIQDRGFDSPSVRRGSAFSMVALPVARWTRISTDDEMLTHLLTLFWTWDNMLTRVVHRGLFLEAMWAERHTTPDSEGVIRHGFCSELMVNAMLAASTVSDLQGSVEVPLC